MSASLEVDLPLGVIRIIVVVPGDEKADGPPPGPPPMAVETTAGLARLGDPVELLRAQTPAEIESMLSDPSIDLVLLDRLDVADSVAMLAVISEGGPPAVVVVSGDSDDEALDAFRAGASDCVQFGSDYERVLPVVLLEQVRRWRMDRQRLVSERRIQRLEDLNTAIVAEMPAALVVLDPDGLIVAENPEFARLFPPWESGGASAGEFLAARMPASLVHTVERLENRAGKNDSESDSVELVRVDVAEGEERAYEIRRRRLFLYRRFAAGIDDTNHDEKEQRCTQYMVESRQRHGSSSRTPWIR